MAADQEHVSRVEKRRRTEAAISDAARTQFAEVGFERTTIRSVASAAGVDPALVMQYFGSKDGLFAAVARQQKPHRRLLDATREDTPQAALDDLFEDLEDPVSRDALLALMRNCLTHEQAATVLRDDVMRHVHEAVASRIATPDAELRAALLGATLVGLSIGRYMLRIPGLAEASREDVERLLLPVLALLVEPAPQA